jgi:hypothetical protein
MWGHLTGKYTLQHCIGLNIPEPLGLLLAGKSVEDLTRLEKENYSYLRKDARIGASKGLTHYP